MDASRPVLWPKFTRFRGDTKRLRFVLTDDQGTVLRPSEHTLFLNLDGADGEPLVQKSSLVGGFTIVDDAAGKVDVQLVPDDDAVLADGVAYSGVIVAVHGETDARHRGRFTLTLVDGLVDEPALTIPTVIVNPDSPYLSAQEIEANRQAAEQAAQSAAEDREQTGLDRIATGQDAQATAADRLAAGENRTATGQDAQATAADRQQTGQDRVATGQDAQATAADRQQTGLDRIATAADRVQTGLDRIAAANSAASVNAGELAARDTSRAPRPGIVSTGASYVGTTADNAGLALGAGAKLWLRYTGLRPTHGTFKYLAAKFSDNLGWKWEWDASDILRLRVGNGSNFTTYAFAASAATGLPANSFAVIDLLADFGAGTLDYYVNGAKHGTTVNISAATAQTLDSTGALYWGSDGTTHFVGEWSECLLAKTALPTASQIADFYRAGAVAPFCSWATNTTTGQQVPTLGSIAFVAWPDFGRADPQNNPIAFDRSGNNQHALLGKSGLTPAVPLLWRNTVPATAIVSNGAATTKVYTTLNSQRTGTGDCVYSWMGIYGQDATTTHRLLVGGTSAPFASNVAAAQSLLVSYSTTEGVTIVLRGSNPVTDLRWLASTSLHTHMAALGARGIATRLDIVRSSSGMRVMLGIGGDASRYYDVTPLFSETTSGTAPAWTAEIDDDYLLGFCRTNTNSSAHPLYDLSLRNYAPTEAKLREIYAAGGVLPEEVGASKAALTSGTLVRGGTYRINTYVAGDSFTNVGAASNTTGVVFVATGTTPTTWTNGSSLERLGLTTRLLPDTAAGLTALNAAKSATNDATDFLFSTSGITTSPDRRRQIIRPGTLTFTSPGTLNLQLFGAPVVDTRYKWRIVSVSGTSNASVNLSLGSASAGTQYVNAQAVTAADFDIGTFANRRISGANLWLASSDTATVSDLCIVLEQVD